MTEPTLGQQLRTKRLRLGWSQNELAWHLRVSVGSLSRWELGWRVPRQRLCRDAVLRFLKTPDEQCVRP